MLAGFAILMMVLALAHFIYEGILAPSLRFEIRQKLFAIRDELRLKKIEGGNDFPDEAFDIVHDSLNTAIGLVSQMSISKAVEMFRALDNDPVLKKAVKQRGAQLDALELEFVKDIRLKYTNAAASAFWVNSGVFIVGLVIPAFFMFFGVKHATSFFSELVAMPFRDFQRFLTDNDSTSLANTGIRAS